MTVNRKVTGTAVGMPAGIIVGWVISMAATIAGSALAAWLISNETMQESSIGYMAMVIILLSTVLGTGMAVHKVKRKILQVSALAGSAYFLSLLGMTAVFFGGIYQGMGVTALLVASGTCAVVLMAGRDKKQSKYRNGRRRV